MTFEELKAGIEELKDNAELKKLLTAMVPVTVDGIQVAIDKDPTLSKKFQEKFVDGPVSKAVEKYEEKFRKEKLPGLVDEEVKKLHPEMTEDQKRIAALEKESKERDEKLKRSELRNHAIKLAGEKKVPIELVDRLIGEDEDSTTKLIELTAGLFDKAITSGVQARLKENGREIEGRQHQLLTGDDLSKMTPEQKLTYANTHPKQE